jgi:hypothetical protein
MRRGSRLRASTLLLAVALSAAPAFARGPQPVPSTEVHGFLSSLWNALAGLLPMPTKGRGTIDPDGFTDGRGTIDPNGAPPVQGATDGQAGLDSHG